MTKDTDEDLRICKEELTDLLRRWQKRSVSQENAAMMLLAAGVWGMRLGKNLSMRLPELLDLVKEMWSMKRSSDG